MAKKQGELKSRREVYADHPANKEPVPEPTSKSEVVNERVFIDQWGLDAVSLQCHPEFSPMLSVELQTGGDRVSIVDVRILTSGAKTYALRRLRTIRNALERAIEFVESVEDVDPTEEGH